MLTVWTECSMASLTVIEQFTVVTGNLLTVYCQLDRQISTLHPAAASLY